MVYPLLRLLDGVAKDALRWALRIALSIVVVVFFAGTIIDPFSFGEAVGAIGSLTAFAVGVALLFYGLSRLAERVHPPQAFVLLRLRRIPVFTLLLLWAILAALFARTTHYYDVRRLDAGGPDFICPSNGHYKTLKEKFDCHALTPKAFLAHWVKRNGRTKVPSEQPDDGPARRSAGLHRRGGRRNSGGLLDRGHAQLHVGEDR